MFRIIVVEDETPIQRSLVDKIQAADEDFKVVGVYSNGEDALIEYELFRPHIVLTDIRMPVMDGLDLIEQLNRHHPEAICAIMTGHQEFQYVHRAMKLGVQTYLLKPPTEAGVREFLLEMKSRLLDNQAYLEDRLLRRWLTAPPAREDEEDNWTNLERELFYHGEHAIIYGWRPPELSVEKNGIEKTNLATRIGEWIRKGEKVYPLPLFGANERGAVIGVYHADENRLTEWTTALKEQLMDTGWSYVVAKVGSPLKRLFHLHQNVRAIAKSKHPLGGSSAACWSETDRIANASSSFFRKDEWLRFSGPLLQKKEWLRELLSDIFTHDRLRGASRRELDTAMQTLTHQLGTHWASPTVDFLIIYEQLRKAVWSAEDASDFLRHLEDILDQLFVEEAEESSESNPARIALYLKERYNDTLSLQDLADRFSLHPYYLSRVFKQAYGKTPPEYVTDLRMEEARRLIREKPRLLFKDVAALVGYDDHYYFSKLFKQKTGVTLTEYKKRCEQDQSFRI